MADTARLILYCPAARPGAQSRAGTADYSYEYVLERFRPVFRRLGPVVEVHKERELASAVSAMAPGSVVFSVAPVDQAPVGCGAPVVPLFAWEFDTLPRWVEDGHEIDWRRTLQQCAAAVALSRHTAEVVRRSTAVPVWSIPAPLVDRFPRVPPGPDRALTFTGTVIDSSAGEEAEIIPRGEEWDGTGIDLRFGDREEASGRLVGFHRPEDWGAWSASPQVRVVLPAAVKGRLRIGLTAVGVGANADRAVTLTCGGSSAQLRLPAELRSAEVMLRPRRPSELITIQGLAPVPSPTPHDRRWLALGLQRLRVDPNPRLRRWPRWRPGRPVAGRSSVTVEGVVYTSVFNPADGRKNWQSMVTAFCAAFRQEPGATLVLKMTHRSAAAYVGPLLTSLRACAPFACRVVALHGHLSLGELARLAAISDYYVNSSTGEGLCMPMIEFMGLGVPAVAPRHTAMADYLDDGNSFAVDWSEYPTCWPQDPSRRWRTHQCRIHWDSLVEQYRRSYRVALDRRSEYEAMARAAAQDMRTFCSDDHVAGQLAQVLDGVLRMGHGS